MSSCERCKVIYLRTLPSLFVKCYMGNRCFIKHKFHKESKEMIYLLTDHIVCFSVVLTQSASFQINTQGQTIGGHFYITSIDYLAVQDWSDGEAGSVLDQQGWEGMDWDPVSCTVNVENRTVGPDETPMESWFCLGEMVEELSTSLSSEILKCKRITP